MYSNFVPAPKGYVDQQGVYHSYYGQAMNWQWTPKTLDGVRTGLRGTSLAGSFQRNADGSYTYQRDAVDTVLGLASLAGGGMGIYHGYKRAGGWGAFGYGLLGFALPIVGIPVFLIQGFGKKKGRR